MELLVSVKFKNHTNRIRRAGIRRRGRDGEILHAQILPPWATSIFSFVTHGGGIVFETRRDCVFMIRSGVTVEPAWGTVPSASTD